MGDVRRSSKKARGMEATPAGEIDSIPDEILELVFLRSLPLELVRAAGTCKRWRRIITADGGRLIRSQHGTPSPHVAGHYRVDRRPHFSRSRPPGRNPVFVPSPPSPWADIFSAARNLALDFLPRPPSSGFCWELADTRGGLLLLVLLSEKKDPATVSRILVCDPMTRAYREVPLSTWFHRCSCLGAFLLDGEDPAGCISLSNFRVTSVLYRIKDAIQRASTYTTAVAGGGRDTIARACTFSSAGGGRWTSSYAQGTTGNDYWRWDCHVSFAGFGGGESVAYWRAGNHGALCLDKDAVELYALPDMPQDELHAPEHAYQLSWPPTIQAALP
ncbi:uncharacterized protein LOC124657494 [Lolium rigidum]|uniref:uncharacterized protein LOC124657494 n=1 Tax=Lolium rigidum TaxID=89674 RepID=UPI001F5D10C8|nr:uncharacterized protein LOC124657494 [Lolium rigidum]